MITILRRFFDICLLRLAPQDLPPSVFLFGVSLLLYVGVGVVLGLQTLSVPLALILTLVDAALLAGMLWILLWIRDLLNRFQQSLTALYGATAVMQALAAPLVLWQPGIVDAETVTTAMMAVSLLLWLWLLWNLMVIGHILRHTIATSLPVGMLLALLYVFASFSVTRSLFFPEAG